MSSIPTFDRVPSEGGPKGPSLALRRAGIDDYSTIRHIQASAIRSLADKLLDIGDIANATRAIYTPGYIADLFKKTVYVAVLNGDIVGTCAWGPSDDRGSAARISALYVGPLFQSNGIGSRLVDEIMRDATHNGFDRFMVTVPVSVIPLFSGLKFAIASYGTSREVIPDTLMQVAFLRKP